MHWATIIWSMIASACLTVAAIHFLVWYRNRASRAALYFVIASVSTAGSAFCELLIMHAETVDAETVAIRLLHVPLLFLFVSITWFVWTYLGAGRRWLAWTIVVLRALYVLPNFVLGQNPNFRDLSIERINFLGESVTVVGGVTNPFLAVGQFGVLLVLAFVADASISTWRRGDRRKAVVGGTILFFLAAALASSLPVLWANARTPLIISPFFLGLIAVMGYELSRDVLRASQLATDLRASEARSLAILRAVPDLMFLQTTDGVYCDYHAPDVRELLLAPEQFLGRNMRDVLPPALLSAIEPAFAQAAGSTEPVLFEYDIDLPQGTRRYEARLVRSNNHQILTMVRDITDRKRAEAALRESAQRYALATAAGAVGVWDWNLETNDIYVDPNLKSILGFDDAEIPNRLDDWGSHVHPDDVAAVMAKAQLCRDGEVEAYEVARRMVHKDGSIRWFLARGSLIRGADGTPSRLVGTDMDITERKQAEEAMRENEAVLQASHREIQYLAGRLIAAQEVERARIARDLHDDLSQQLAGLSIALSAVKRRVAALPGTNDLEGDISSLQKRAIALAEDIRDLSHELHPSMLKHAELVAALAAHCAGIQRRENVVVTFRAEGDFGSTSPEASLCLYRVTQEALRNVVTHAGASHAEVHLIRRDESAELTIADDGRGFDIAQVTNGIKGLGLVSIHERVRLAGGTVSIVTELQKGTRVRVRVPVNPGSGSAAAGGSGSYATTA